MTRSHHASTWKSVEQEATFTFDPGILVRLLHSPARREVASLGITFQDNSEYHFYAI